MSIKQKYSYGIALCRYNKQKNNIVEILSIKKRFTYAYFAFLFGFYANKNIKNTSSYLKYLFNNMSHQEKLLILSMDYSAMWWYVWLNNPERGLNIIAKNVNNDYRIYFKQKNRFDTKMGHDGGSKLYELINNSTSYDSIWEIPKGSKTPNETDLDAALREFEEETLIDRKYLRVLYNVKPIVVTKKSNGILYKFVYYIAELTDEGALNNDIINPKINFSSMMQISEVYDIKWISENYIHSISMSEYEQKHMLATYKKVINKFKKNNKLKNRSHQ